MPEEEKREEKREEGGKDDKKKGGLFENKKTLYWTIGLGTAGLLLTLYMLNKNSSTAQDANQLASDLTNPYGALPYGNQFYPQQSGQMDYWPPVTGQGQGTTTSPPGGTQTGQTNGSTPGNANNGGGGSNTTSGGGQKQGGGTSNGGNKSGGSNGGQKQQPAPKPTSNPVKKFVQKVFPSKPGTKGLSPNAWIYTVGKGETLGEVTRNVAKWGNNWSDLVNYRDNAKVFASIPGFHYGPNYVLPEGLKIAV